MSELVLLTSAADPPGEILPAISLLLHSVRTAPAEASALADSPAADAVLVDARRDLARARELCRLLRGAGTEIPLLAVLTEGGLAAVTADWGTDEVILNTAGPAEVEARLRLAIGRQASLSPAAPDEIHSGDLAIDEATYSARLRTRALDLTFKEFELLKFLAQHPGRVFTRAHLLQEVWGYDYFGGTRTVDVHVRRLRAKLGAEHEALIGTVRNVGYRFVPLRPEDGGRGYPRGAGDAAPAGTAAADTAAATRDGGITRAGVSTRAGGSTGSGDSSRDGGGTSSGGGSRDGGGTSSGAGTRDGGGDMAPAGRAAAAGDGTGGGRLRDEGGGRLPAPGQMERRRSSPARADR